MVSLPAWFRQLKWSAPVNVANLNLDRKKIPDFPGCYAFTIGMINLIPDQVLYVGEGKSLRNRIPAYLVVITKSKAKEGHKGKGFVLEARDKHNDYSVFVRWVEYGGSDHDRYELEASLIGYLRPGANDRDEEARHGALGDWERLDPRLLR